MLIPFKNLLTIKKKITGIIHIGAHELEELPSYNEKKIKKIIWIEANPNKYKFIENTLFNYSEMILGKFAAGSRKDNLTLNISNNSQSSSILPLGTHKISYPDIVYKNKIKVDVVPFDDWASERNIEKGLYNFINIDIQGYEIEALKGMTKQLLFADYIYLEVNFVQVYKNCAQITDIDNFLRKYNFIRVGTYKTNQGWGDAIYVNKFTLLNKIYYNIVINILKIKKLIKKIKNFLIFKFKK